MLENEREESLQYPYNIPTTSLQHPYNIPTRDKKDRHLIVTVSLGCQLPHFPCRDSSIIAYHISMSTKSKNRQQQEQMTNTYCSGFRKLHIYLKGVILLYQSNPKLSTNSAK